MRFLALLLALVAVSVQGFDSALFDAIDAGKTTEALELLQSVEHPDKYETFTKDNASRKRFNYSFLHVNRAVVLLFYVFVIVHGLKATVSRLSSDVATTGTRARALFLQLGQNALSKAVMKGNTQVVKALLAAGANPNHGFEIEGDVTSSLTAAIPKSTPDIIAALIDAGADLNGHASAVSVKGNM